VRDAWGGANWGLLLLELLSRPLRVMLEKNGLVAVDVLQSSPLLEPPVAHDGGSGEGGGLQHHYGHPVTNIEYFWSGIIC
jgi:hypothetical protein